MNSFSESNPNLRPALYSARAVRIFSALFSAVAGGALTASNLRATGHPAEASKAIGGSILYTALVLLVAAYLPENMVGTWIGVVTGLAGGMGLEAYFKQQEPERDAHPTKSIVKPLLICLAIFVPLVGLLFYAMTLPQA